MRERFFFPQFSIVDSKKVRRSALCRSRRELSHEYLLAKFASIQPRMSPLKFARSPCIITDPPGAIRLSIWNTYVKDPPPPESYFLTQTCKQIYDFFYAITLFAATFYFCETDKTIRRSYRDGICRYVYPVSSGGRLES